MLDSAGRLQIPRLYREALGIQQRVRLEITEEGLLIRPLEREEHPEGTIPSAGDTIQPDHQGNWWQRWRHRFWSR